MTDPCPRCLALGAETARLRDELTGSENAHTRTIVWAQGLATAIRRASDILHASYAKPGRQVASAAAEARRVLEEAVGKEKGS